MNVVSNETGQILEFLPGTPQGKPAIRFRGTLIGFQLNEDGTVTLAGASLVATTTVLRTADAATHNVTSISGTTQTTYGIGFPNATYLSFIAGGSISAALTTEGLVVMANKALGWSAVAAGAGAPGTVDVSLFRDGASDILALRRSTTAQTLRIYNTYTDASNGEWLSIDWTSNSNLASIFTKANGTGTIRALQLGAGVGAGITFFSNGVAKLQLTSAGNLLPQTDLGSNLGSGTNRWNVGFIRTVVGAVTAVAYSASITPDASLGNYQQISPNNGTAFTINAPTNPTTGQLLSLTIRNVSGGALGVITWNAVFKMPAWTSPANTFSRSILFVYDGTNWVEIFRSAADVPN
jgi:hypothetical protein